MNQVVYEVNANEDKTGFNFKLLNIPYMDNVMFAISDRAIEIDQVPAKRDAEHDISSGNECHFSNAKLICPNTPFQFSDERYKCKMSTFGECRSMDCEWFVSKEEADRDEHVVKNNNQLFTSYKFDMFVGYYIPSNLVGPGSDHLQQSQVTFQTKPESLGSRTYWIIAGVASMAVGLVILAIGAIVAVFKYRQFKKGSAPQVKLTYQQLA
jgi:hypothetical protein